MTAGAPSARPATRVLLIWLLLEAIAALQVHGPDGQLLLTSWVRAAVHPAVWVVEATFDQLRALGTGLSDVRRLAGENENLRRQLEVTRTENTILATDLIATREALEVALATPMTSFEVGRCLYRDLNRGLLVVSVPPGANIRRNAAVVATGGLVGRVIRIEADRCWVETLLTPGAAVAVQTADRGHQGVAEGTGRRGLRIQYLGRQTSVTRGEILSTSGADGLYPPDLPVAEVTFVRESSAPFLSVGALPTVDLVNLRAVAILTGLDPVGSSPRGESP